METLLNIEYAIIIFLQNNLSQSFMNYFAFMADFADEIITIAIIGVFYWGIDKKFGFKLLMYISIADILFPMIKDTVRRVRPYMANKDIKCIKPVHEGDSNSVDVQGYSFPSGHSLNATLIYMPIINKIKNIIIRVLCIIIILSVYLGRIALGVHYPTDVLCSILLGLIVMIGYNFLINKFSINKVYLLLVIICVAGLFYCKSDVYFTGAGLLIGCILANIFENKYVKFENTNNIFEIIVRLIGGMVVFISLSFGLKLPFSEEFLCNNSLLSHLVRTARYIIIIFSVLGVYPMCFKYIKLKNRK